MADRESSGKCKSNQRDDGKPAGVNKTRAGVKLGEPAVRVIGRENNDGKIRKAILGFQIFAALFFALQKEKNIFFLRSAVPKACGFQLRGKFGDCLLVIEFASLLRIQFGNFGIRARTVEELRQRPLRGV